MHQAILRKVRAYRARIRACVTVEGVSNAALVLVGLVFLSLLIDYYRRLSLEARIFSLAVGLGVIGFVVYRRLIVKLGQPMDDERVALTVEDKFPELQDRLISTLQFAESLESGQSGRDGQSLVMMSAVTADAAAAFEPLDLGRTIDYGRITRVAGAACVACIVLGAFAASRPGVMSLWLQRNVLMMNVAWPQRTHLAVECPKTLPKGDALTVVVRASGTLIPSTVTVNYKFLDSGKRGEEDMARIGLVADNKFEVKFKNVVEPIEFTVSGGDAETERFSVTLVERPTIMQLKFWAVYPSYTRKEAKELAASESFLEALPGTNIKVAAVPSKPLKGAWLALEDDEKGIPMILAADKVTKDFWMRPDEQAAMAKAAAQKTGVNEFWTGAMKMTEDCSVSVRVLDTDGLENRPPARFTVKIIADKEPMVTIKMKGIGEMIVPNATIPLEIKATDDFGVEGLALRHKCVIEEKTFGEEVIPFRLVYGGKEVPHSLQWDVQPLGLVPGSAFVFNAEATDYKDTKPKNLGKSESFSLRVVTPDELRADLVRRQIEQYQDLARVRDRQRDEIKIEIDAAARAIEAKGTLTDEQKNRLGSVEESIRHSGEEVKHSANVLDQVLMEMINNKVGDQEEQSKFRVTVVAPGRRLADTLMPELAEGAKAVPALTTGTALKSQVASLVDQNNAILKEMDALVNNMLKMETFRRIVITAQEIRDAQGKLLTDIEKERIDLLKSILGV